MVETAEVHVLGVRPIPDKKWEVLKCDGKREFFAWKGGLPTEKINGQVCVAEYDPPKEEGKSPSLKKLVVKETGEVVYEDAGRGSGGGGGGWRGGGAKDPAERASIEAQSALAHTLQEVRMAKDLLVGVVQAVAPYIDDLTMESALTFVTERLDSTTAAIRGIRAAEFGKLADELAKVRSRNMGSSESGSRSKGTAASGTQARGKSLSGSSATGEPPPAPGDRAGDGPGSGSDTPTGKASKQAAALEKFGSIAKFKKAFEATFGEAKSPGQATESELDAMLSAEVPA